LRGVPLCFLHDAGRAALRAGSAGNWTNKGPFNLKGASVPIAVLALIGCAVLIFVGVQPPQERWAT
jgi:hypothetical protein